MTPIQALKHYRYVLFKMRAKRWIKQRGFTVFAIAGVTGLCLQSYTVGKTVGQERMLRILVPHLCMPADPDANSDRT